MIWVPFNLGCAPLPYAPEVMGLPVLPEKGGTNCCRHVHPLWNRLESPGLKVWEFTLRIAGHGVEGLVPLLISAPMIAQLSTSYVDAYACPRKPVVKDLRKPEMRMDCVFCLTAIQGTLANLYDMIH